MNEIIIDPKCDVCCECINICTQDVLGIQGGKVKATGFDDCTFCEECVDICPEGNIKIRFDI